VSQNAPAAGPIADLTYRNYDGPLRVRRRWWVIAVAGIRLAISRRYFWVIFAMAMLPAVFTIIGLNIESQSRKAANLTLEGQMMMAQLPPTDYTLTFFNVLTMQELWLFSLALAVGAGSIASDLRSNALLVYLSKPLTRIDYVLGKWASVFLALFGTALLPVLVLYLYCFFSFGKEGFFKNEPYLLPAALGAAAIPAAIHASLLLGCSACSRSGRMAGAMYAGLYFLGGTMSMMLWGILHRGDLTKGYLVRNLSIQGVIATLEQNILDATILPTGLRRMSGGGIEIPPQDFGVFAGLAVGLIVLALAAAWSRIRAVEVVSG
jgi:ABC-2 type transport system permease protein